MARVFIRIGSNTGLSGSFKVLILKGYSLLFYKPEYFVTLFVRVESRTDSSPPPGLSVGYLNPSGAGGMGVMDLSKCGKVRNRAPHHAFSSGVTPLPAQSRTSSQIVLFWGAHRAVATARCTC